MTDIDLSAIDPVRRPEVRRRIGILDDYLAIERPTAEDTAAHSLRMGVRRSTFYALVRVWREGRDPNRVFGSGTRSGRGRNETNDLPPASLAAVDSVIRAMGPWAPDQSMIRRIGERLEREKLAPVSDATVRLQIDRARSTSKERSPFAPAILVDRCRLKLPLATPDGPMWPVACLAVAVPENLILAYRIGTDESPPNDREVVAEVSRLATTGAERRPVVTGRLASGLADGDGPTGGRARGPLRIRRLLGASIGDVGFLVNEGRAGADRPRSRFDRDLSRSEVETAFAQAVARHNCGRETMPPFSI